MDMIYLFITKKFIFQDLLHLLLEAPCTWKLSSTLLRETVSTGWHQFLWNYFMTQLLHWWMTKFWLAEVTKTETVTNTFPTVIAGHFFQLEISTILGFQEWS
jgi:hypothetical protein